MKTPGPSFEALSAYVDGELDPSEAARVASAAVGDPAVASAIARLQALRAVISNVPDVVHLASHRRRTDLRRLPAWAAAAALVAAIALSATLLLWRGEGNVPALARDMAPMVDLHDRWLETSVPSSALRVASAAPVDTLLAATGLRLVLRDRVAFEGREAMHSRFVGERGCRLSLFEWAGDGDGAERLDTSEEDGLHVARWAATDRAYALIARDMDAARFAMIAGSLRQILPEDTDRQATRLAQALGAARQPCLTG